MSTRRSAASDRAASKRSSNRRSIMGSGFRIACFAAAGIAAGAGLVGAVFHVTISAINIGLLVAAPLIAYLPWFMRRVRVLQIGQVRAEFERETNPVADAESDAEQKPETAGEATSPDIISAGDWGRMLTLAEELEQVRTRQEIGPGRTDAVIK